ncbi:MAG: 50S ribosomal protein L10 [Pseudomonadota bacterium]
MIRAQKVERVKALTKELENAAGVFVTRGEGLDATQTYELRCRLNEVGAQFRVVKNRLVRIALADTPVKAVADTVAGATALVLAEDPLAAAKALTKFANDNKQHLTLVSGVVDGELIDETTIKALAALPSQDELRAKILGLLMTPASRLARVTQAPAQHLAAVLAARAAQ